MNLFKNVDEIKRRFYSYDKEKQKFLIYHIYIATGLFLDFMEKYNILVRENLHKDTYIILRVHLYYYYKLKNHFSYA